MVEALSVMMSAVSATAWRAGRARSGIARRGWGLASALAAALSVGLLLTGPTDPGAAWLVPLAAWLAAATCVVLVYPLAPRAVEIGAGILGVAGAIAGGLQLTGGALAS